jgi:hypothetical protein
MLRVARLLVSSTVLARWALEGAEMLPFFISPGLLELTD